jgi:hypothetical protein
MEHHAYSLQNLPARVQFQPTEIGLALRCARIAFAVAYPEFTLTSIATYRPFVNLSLDIILTNAAIGNLQVSLLESDY